jgi:hypothetical protein
VGFQLITSLVGEVTQREIRAKQDLTNPQTATLEAPMKQFPGSPGKIR